MNELSKERTKESRIIEDPENDKSYQDWINRTPEQIKEFSQNIIKDLIFYLETTINQNIIPDENESQSLLFLLTGLSEKIISGIKENNYKYDYKWANIFIECLKTFMKNVLNFSLENPILKESLKNYTPETTPLNNIRFVYIAKSKGLYKIGVTKDLVKRLKQFTTGNPEIEIIASLKTSYYNANEIERKLHNVYKLNNIKNEWFNFSKNEIEFIIKEMRFNYHV